MDWRPRLVEDGSGRDRDLVAALGALPQKPARYLQGALEPTGRTAESIWPAAGKEIVATSGVIWKPVLELEDRPWEIRPRHAEIVAELTG